MSNKDAFRSVWIDRKEVEQFVDKTTVDTQSAFLRLSGVEEGNRALFALSVPKNTGEDKIGLVERQLNAKFTNLRLVMLSGNESTLSQGYSLLRWLHSTKFCSKCGSPATKNVSGSRIKCSNNNCGLVFHPPTSPVGIVLVASTDHSKLLLVRQPQYPVGMYSCVAGFVDIGETIYDCVKREVAEEAGIEILPNDDSNNFKVILSQHWPFPNGSLMTGCIALAPCPGQPGSNAPKIDDHGEIENVRWFEVKEIVEAIKRIDKTPMLRLTGVNGEFKASDVFVPPRGAIAHQMLKLWLIKYHNMVFD